MFRFNKNFINYIIIPIIISLIVLIAINYFLPIFLINECSLNVFIAILSQRNHFNRRQTLRQTWIQTIDRINKNNNLIESNNCGINLYTKFIIGDKDCPIDPILRTNQYSCHLNEIKINENNSEIQLFGLNTIKEQSFQSLSFKTLFRGFSFVIRHSIIVTKIGVHQNFLSQHKNITIVLLNGQNKESIKSVEISLNSLKLNDVFYKDIEPLVLAKDFYGLLIIDNKLFDFNYNYTSNVTLNQNGFIDILRAYYGFTDYESISYNSKLILGPTLLYKVSDSEYLELLMKSKNKIQNKWNNELSLTEERLSKEILLNKDILLVNSIDIYRNLPEKVLQSIHFAVQSYDLTHYLKTDDDCFLNVFNIIEELIPNKDMKKVWFGNFRRLWSTDRWGKWAENDYESPIYPPFACGSGYILSLDLVQWIASNFNHLHRFQGEDVSMGIWMSAINPQLNEDKRWVCSDSDFNISQSFSFPQLEDKQIIKIHNFLEKYNKK